MPLTIGQVIHNRYRIAALLGQGGMGDVYRAWDLSLKILVAIKENLDASPEALEQFGEEARLLARLSHPSLPRVIDYFTIPGQGDYLVMDYVEGEDLESLLARTPADPAGVQHLAEKTVTPWMIQMCSALSYLHSQQPPVIHRDVKPANIKITPDGRAMLVDFGIAKRYDPQRATFLGARAVTPGYSPPEQYGGASTDPRSDIYALGATFYHLLSGQAPPESVQRVAGTTASLAPRASNPAISPAIEQVILKAMAVPMDQRYQSAAQFEAALQAASAAWPARSAGGSAAPPLQPAAGQSRPVPTPVEPLPRRITTTPPPPKGFLATNWPLLLLSGIVLVILLLFAAQAIMNQVADRKAAAEIVLPSLTAPPPTPTSAIDALIAKSGATQTAQVVVAASTVPTQPLATPRAPDYARRLYDGFKDNQNEWFTGIDGSLACWILVSRYTCQTQAGQAANHFQWLERYPLPDRFTLAVDVWPGPARPRSLGDANAGLVFRATEQGRYLFSVRNDGAFRLSSVQTGPANWVDVIPWTRSPAIQPGEDNRLLVAGDGSHYDLFINGQFVGGFDDSFWSDGYPGLHLFTAPAEKPAMVEFDSFELRTP
jgi:eukaryotic-like serine/threonine-protein kinase